MDHRPSQFTLRVEAQGALLYSRRTHAYTWRTPAEAFLLVAAQDMGVATDSKAPAAPRRCPVIDLVEVTTT